MKLYGEAMPAPNPRRVRIFLAEKGMEVPEIRIGMREGGQPQSRTSGAQQSWSGAGAGTG